MNMVNTLETLGPFQRWYLCLNHIQRPIRSKQSSIR